MANDSISKRYDDIFSQAKSSGIMCLNLMNYFGSQQNKQQFFWKFDFHCNAAGYKAMAQEVADYLFENLPERKIN